MTARKIKHQNALDKRAKFMTTVKEGNLKVLDKVRDQRADEEKRAQEALKQKKIAKSKELAQKNGAVKKPTHVPMKKGRSTLAKMAGKAKKEQS